MPILKFASKHQWRIYQKCLLREGLYQKSLNSETELFVVKLPLPNVSANTTESSSQCLYFRHEHAAHCAQPGQWQGWEVKDKNAAIFIIASAALQSALYLLLLHSHHLDIVISRFTDQKIFFGQVRQILCTFFCEISYQLSSFAANHTVEQKGFSQNSSILIFPRLMPTSRLVHNQRSYWILASDTVFVNSTNISSNIETAMLSTISPPFDANLAQGPHAGCDSCWS